MTDYPPTLVLRVQPPDEKNIYQVVEFQGDMDKAGLEVVKERLETLATTFPCKYLVFDFSDLNYVNSEGIGFLIALHSHLVKLKKGLVFLSAKPHVKDVFYVIGILSIVEYYESMDSFLKKVA